jgi:small subunit ribosomal protein S20
MPHSKQAKKRYRQDEKRKALNRSLKSSMNTHIKKVVKAVKEGDQEQARTLLPLAMKKVDKAAKGRVIHKNQASRKIANLSKKVQALEGEKDTKGSGEV